ncbi:MAG: ABC transporter ATP-binding protein [Pseudomonadota bacterium]
MTQPVVTMSGVVKRYGDFTAVHALDLAIGSGEFIAIMGPSGCGKTTTLRMLAGLESPTEGEIRIDGLLMNEVPPHQRDTPMVWQSLALFPFLNARQNVEFGLKMRGVTPAERSARALEWLDKLEIAEFAERPVDTLSGGQRQRVALARSLVTEPKILLLDEPLSALDAHLVIRMQGVLTRLQRDLGITFVYVTHSQSEAFAMADRVVIMSQGRIAQIGSAREIYRAPASRFVAEFVGRNNILAGTARDGTIQTGLGAFTVASDGPDGPASLVIAADLMQVARAPQPGSIPCSLISEEFVGAMVTLFLEAADGTELKVQVQERALADLNLHSGGIFHLSWPADAAHLIAEG